MQAKVFSNTAWAKHARTIVDYNAAVFKCFTSGKDKVIKKYIGL